MPKKRRRPRKPDIDTGFLPWEVIKVTSDQEVLGVLDRVRKEGVAIKVEREGVPGIVVMRVEEHRRGMLLPHKVPMVAEGAVEEALSLAGAWKDLDTDAMFKAIYEARHRFQTRPPVTFND
ncbi:MAG: hypothetical protein ACE5IZ_09405, partial [Dehalococcoidia bacterium]